MLVGSAWPTAWLMVTVGWTVSLFAVFDAVAVLPAASLAVAV